MRFGYNTNGFAHHRLEDTLTILAELGYESAAITLDHYALNPCDSDLPRQLSGVRTLLRRLNLHCVIETGARFLLDPRQKHQPTLLSADEGDRHRRLDFLMRAVDIASELGTDLVSFWSGTPREPAAHTVLLERLEFRSLLTRFVAVCNTIAYAHTRGIIHRDLKPDNIVLGEYGETAILDWGLAKVLHKDRVDPEALPKFPPVAARDALNTFRLKAGFRLELVAAEPLVTEPIALEFDEDGRLFVVEMSDFPESDKQHHGQVKRLEDTDGDGRFDKATVFADGLRWPSAVHCYGGGVFVGAVPDLFFYKDTNDDGVVDAYSPPAACG